MTDDEAQGTLGKRKVRVVATSRPFSPSRLPLRANFHRGGRRLGTRQGTHCFSLKKITTESIRCYVSYVEVRLLSRGKFKITNMEKKKGETARNAAN